MISIGTFAGGNGSGIQMPEAIEVDDATYSTTYGKFILQPLERGYGITIGNAMRRVLLSSLPGAAVTSLKIDGVLHEFSTIRGVKEDVTEIVLALKSVRLKLLSPKPEKVRLHLKGPKVFTARDIQAGTTEFEILNPDLVIANLNEEAEFNMELTMKRGRGYVPAEDNREPDTPIGTIPLDAVYTPVVRVKYAVENTRVGQKTDYDRLILEVWTDGSITPDDALIQAGRLLREHIQLFIDLHLRHEAAEEHEETDEEVMRVRRLLRKSVEELNLSVRSANVLKEAKIRTIAELVARDENDLLKFKNFGRKSLMELNEILAGLGLHFGFDVEKYLGSETRRNPV